MKLERLHLEQEFYPNGKLHKQRVSNLKGVSHNEGGPAYQEWREDGSKKLEIYITNGNYHRIGGPAHIEWDRGSLVSFSYMLNGKRTRLDGPAAMTTSLSGAREYQFYIDDQLLSKECFKERKKELTEPTCDGKIVTIDGKEYYLTLKE